VELKNLKDLIDFTVSTKECFFLDEFSKDASNCPDIHAEAVLPLAEQNLWRAVPEGLDLMREGLNWNSKSAGEAKISNFEHTCIQQKVPFLSTKRFCGLRSRWMMRREWQKLMPLTSWNMIRRIWFCVIVFLF